MAVRHRPRIASRLRYGSSSLDPTPSDVGRRFVLQGARSCLPVVGVLRYAKARPNLVPIAPFLTDYALELPGGYRVELTSRDRLDEVEPEAVDQ